MAVDNPGRRRIDSGLCADFRFEGQGLLLSQQGEIEYAISLGVHFYFFEPFTFRIVDSDNQFTCALMRDVSFPAWVIEEPVSLCTQGGLEKAVGVVNAGVYNLTIATACLLAAAVIFFKKQYPLILCRKLFCNGQAHYSGGR